jgi:prevent-host-death family protein
MGFRVHDNIVGAYDAKAHFSELLERVESGEQLTITRHGKPVARLVPVKQSVTRQERAAAIQRWREESGDISLGGLKIRDLINEGRP